jgi:uncharacterized protein (TIRG00374 family)
MERFKLILKIVVSLGLLIYLIILAKPEEIIKVIATIWNAGGIIYIIFAVTIFLVSIYIYSVRWQILIKGYRLKISLFKLFTFYLMGLFFNNFLPTSIGGDIIRIHKLIQHIGERTIGFASVLTERLMGFISSLLLTLISLIIMTNQFENLNLLYFTIGLLCLLLTFFVFVFFDCLFNLLNEFIIKIRIFRLGERIMKFLEALRFYRNNKWIFLYVFFISTVGQIAIIIMIYLIVLALQLNVSLGYLFLVVPVTFLLTLIPSINGLGVRDGGFVFLFGKIGISSAAALSVSFIAIIIPMFISIIGGILFILNKENVRLKEIDFVK